MKVCKPITHNHFAPSGRCLKLWRNRCKSKGGGKSTRLLQDHVLVWPRPASKASQIFIARGLHIQMPLLS